MSSLGRMPQANLNANSGAGFSSKSPYSGAAAYKPTSGIGAASGLAKAGAGSLNTNVFNIGKYGGMGGGMGGGIGGGMGGGIGGGIGGGLGRSSGIGSSGGGIGSAGDNKQQEDNEFGGRYKM